MPTLDQAFEELGIKNVKKKGNAVMNCRFSSILDLINMKDRLQFWSDWNKEKFHSEFEENSRVEWRGGTMKRLKSDLAGQKDMTTYIKARKKLEETGVMQSLKTIIEKVRPKRSRLYSEHDGDWDMTRQWEILPFHSTTRSLAEGKFLDIEATFSINSGGASEALDQYGTLVWAISDLVEQCGVCTRIVYRLDTKALSADKEIDSVVDILVKDTGQYVAPPILAAVFQSNFFRRFGFAALTMAMDHIGKKVSSGLGRMREHNESIIFEDGKIKTRPSLYMQPEKMVRVLLEAFDPSKGGVRG